MQRASVRLWWEKNQHLFLLPACYGGHKHVWTVIDLDCVGCTMCGVVHICGDRNNIVPCCQELQSDTSVVCTYTGVVIENSTMYNETCSTQSFRIDSVSMPSVHDTTPIKKPSTKSQLSQMEKIRHLAKQIIQQLFFSEDAARCREKEEQRVSQKIQAAFVNHTQKNRFQHGCYDILSALESSIHVYNQFHRENDPEQLRAINWKKFQDHLCYTIGFIFNPSQLQVHERNDFFRNLIIAYIYMSKSGLKKSSVTFIPEHKILTQCLPLEVFLWPCFKIQAKVITEGENILKHFINKLDCERLLDFKRNLKINQS